MNQDPQNFEEKKKKVLDEITDILLTALEKNILLKEEGQIIATYILDQTKASNTEQDLIHFLQKLSEQWAIFQKVSDSNRQNIELNKKIQEVNTIDKHKIDEIKARLTSLSSKSN